MKNWEILYEIHLHYGDYGLEEKRFSIIGCNDAMHFCRCCKEAINCHEVMCINAFTGEIIYHYHNGKVEVSR